MGSECMSPVSSSYCARNKQVHMHDIVHLQVLARVSTWQDLSKDSFVVLYITMLMYPHTPHHMQHPLGSLVHQS